MGQVSLFVQAGACTGLCKLGVGPIAFQPYRMIFTCFQINPPAMTNMLTCKLCPPPGGHCKERRGRPSGLGSDVLEDTSNPGTGSRSPRERRRLQAPERCRFASGETPLYTIGRSRGQLAGLGDVLQRWGLGPPPNTSKPRAEEALEGPPNSEPGRLRANTSSEWARARPWPGPCPAGGQSIQSTNGREIVEFLHKKDRREAQRASPKAFLCRNIHDRTTF